MPDTMHIQLQLTITESETGTVTGTQEVTESLELDCQLGDFLGPVKKTLGTPVDGGGHAVPQSLVLPSQPYDAVLFLRCQNPLHLNVNGQGNQVVTGAFISMASVASATVTNDIIPVGQTTPQPNEIRYILAKQSSS